MPKSASDYVVIFLRAAFFLLTLYLFFVSIDLLSTAFKMAGRGFAERLIHTASDPVAGLIIGFLATSLIQSSSTTTSIVVGLVAAGTLDIPMAIPIIMGANIGTTVTNTIVSIGHVRRPSEFKHAFAASTVHDFFNILAALILLPLEVIFHPVEKLALYLERIFEGVGGLQLISPLHAIVRPVNNAIADLIPYALPLVIIALLILFCSLSQMVRVMRRIVLSRVESLFSRVLFRNDLTSFTLGTFITATVQSSSATTSLIVPLVGTGVLTVRKIFPYTLGANVGTTITAILASFATGSELAVTVALAHLSFNIIGIVLLYPGRAVPIWLANQVGALAAKSKGNSALVILTYIALHIIPIIYVFMR